MKWSELHAPAAWDWFPDSLVKEAKRLGREVATVEKKRAKADDLAGVVVDLANDRSPYLRATIEAIEAELQVRDALIVFLTAREHAQADIRRCAEDKIAAVAAKRRKELRIPANVIVPAAVLENTADWWDARGELLACPHVDASHERLQHQEEIGRIEARLVQLKATLAGEADRRAGFIEARRADAEYVGAGQREYEETTAACDRLHERAAGLLK